MIPNTRGVSGGDHDDRAKEENPVPPAPGRALMRNKLKIKPVSLLKKISTQSEKSPIFISWSDWKYQIYFSEIYLLENWRVLSAIAFAVPVL